MGIDPAILHQPQIARLMSPADRRAFKIQTSAEAAQAQAAEYEADLQSQAELELHRAGIAYLHLSPRAREKAGWPDLAFVLPNRTGPGTPWALELKSATGRLSTDQERMLAQMEANGWRTAVVRDLLAVKAILATRHLPEIHSP